MAKPIESPAGYVVSPRKSFRCSQLIVPTWDARFDGFRSRACSCALATGAPTMRTEAGLQVHPSEGYSRTTLRLLMGPFRSTPVRCQPSPTQPSSFRLRTQREDRHAPVEGSLHLVR